MLPWVEGRRGKVHERGYQARDALKTELVRIRIILELIQMIKKKVHGPIFFSLKAGSSMGRTSGRVKKVKFSLEDRESSRSSTSGRTTTTTKNNYSRMTGQSPWAQHQEHRIQDLKILLLEGKGGKEGTSLNICTQ